MRPSRLATFLALGLAPGASAAGPPAASEFAMVADLNTIRSGGTDYWELATSFAAHDGALFAPLDDGIHGVELWALDGTPEGSRLVADLCPGICSALPSELTFAGGLLFFTANDGALGEELWVSDGSAAGTMPLDLVAGSRSSQPTHLRSFAGRVYFSARLETTGREPWVSDGTPGGTSLLADLLPGEASSDPMFLAEVGGKLLFAASDPMHGRELWATDGTAAGTGLLADVRSGPESGLPFGQSHPGYRSWTTSGDRLFVIAVTAAGERLWVSDGTSQGTAQVDAEPPGYWSIDTLESLGGGRVALTVFDRALGQELWVSDGTAAGTGLALDIMPGPTGSHPRLYAAWGEKGFLYADDGVHGFEPWATDGTAAGTVLLADAMPGPAGQEWTSGFPPFPVPFGERLVFFAGDGTIGFEPWVTDGTSAGTAALADVNPGPAGSAPAERAFDLPTDFGPLAIFRAFDPVHGVEPWVTDGTSAGTRRLEVNRQTSSFLISKFWSALARPRALGAFGERILFQGGEAEVDFEPWVSDGTAAGTYRLLDLVPGTDSSWPVGFAAVGPTDALFQGWDGQKEMLWRTDGTAEGTAALAELGEWGGALHCAQPFGGGLLYSSTDGLWRIAEPTAVPVLISGSGGSYTTCESWGSRIALLLGGVVPAVSDGTSEGTHRFDIPATGAFNTLAASGDRLFFVAQDEPGGYELWTSDASQAGTGQVVDLLPGPGSGVLPDLALSYLFGATLAPLPGSRVLFPGDDGTGGQEPWVSDGTLPGTFRLADLALGGGSSRPGWLTACDGRVYFAADDGTSGRELWASDGTREGTVRVADVHPGAGSGRPEYLTCFGSQLAFSADDGVHGREPWVTDGTAAGTRLAGDLAPGPTPSSPLDFTRAGGFVYFAATDGVHGFELWRWRLAPLELFRDGFESGDLEGWSASDAP